jgi:hypothetical protein
VATLRSEFVDPGAQPFPMFTECGDDIWIAGSLNGVADPRIHHPGLTL